MIFGRIGLFGTYAYISFLSILKKMSSLQKWLEHDTVSQRKSFEYLTFNHDCLNCFTFTAFTVKEGNT